MFGLLMLILFIVAWFVTNISKNNDVRRSRKRAMENGQDSYLDRNGYLVDIKSDIPFAYEKINGDTWKVHAYTRKPLENLSAQKREETDAKERAKAIAEGKSIYPFEGYVSHEKDEIVGVRYKDLKTGEIYVKRRLNAGVWLLNTRTCRFDRLDDNFPNDQFYILKEYETDDGMPRSKTEHVGEKEALEYLNQKQEEACKKENNSFWKWRNDAKTIL